MPFVTLGLPNHDTIPGVSATDHHTPTVAGDLDLADLAGRAHGDLADSPADAHHNQAHTIALHSDSGNVCRMATGVFTGNGGTAQAISGVGFQVKWLYIIIQASADNDNISDRELIFTSDTIVDDNALGLVMNLVNNVVNTKTDAIIVLGSDGFTIDDGGGDEDPNMNGQVYNFIAFGV